MKKFLIILGSFLVFLIVGIVPLYFGLPEGRQVQSIVAAPTLQTSGFESTTDMLVHWLVYFTNNSFPNVWLHYLLVGLGAITILALIFGYKPKVSSRGIMYGALGWGAIMLGMLYADSEIPLAFKSYGMCANFMLYGVWFLAIAVFLDSQNKREAAMMILMASAVIVCFWAFDQYRFGLEEMRQTYAVNEGYESFMAYTNSVLSANLDPIKELAIKKLSSQRVFGTFVYPNALGGFLILVIPIALSFCFSQKISSVKLFASVVLLLSLFVLMLSRSKASIGIVCLVVIMLLYYARFTKSITNVNWITCSIATLGIAFLMLYWGYGSSLTSRLQATGGARLDYWKAAIDMIKDNPIKGWGSGGFSRNYLAYCRPGAEETRLAHNAYLNMWTDYGLAGFLGLIFTFTIGCIQGLANITSKKPFNWLSAACALASLGFMIHCFLDFDFHIPGIVLPALMMIVIAQTPTTRLKL